MEYKGVIVGLCAFLVVGMFHPLVIKVEYYIGRKVWWVFALAAVASVVGSLFVSYWYSQVLGVIGAAFAWSTLELRWQHIRVAKGRAKRNPKRPESYYQLNAKS